MSVPRFLIVDGYPEKSRAQFREVGMKLAWELYADLLKKHMPDAQYDVWISSDPESPPVPDPKTVAGYAGVLWPGCNLTVYHDDPRVKRHLDLAETCFDVGTPSFGSCWAIQVACYVAGGKVAANPKGREMGVGEKVLLTEAGRNHPMYEGKPQVFSHFHSHDDEVTELPECATLLAGNYWSHVQAAEVRYKKGVFWAVQYHPEYNLHEMARLIQARAQKLIELGYFRDHADLFDYVARLDELVKEPQRKDLRWQMKIDDDVLDDDLRELEFKNWLKYVVKPRLG